MKKKITIIIAVVFLSLSGTKVFSQPLPPGFPDGHGQPTDQPGGGAPIDGGLSMLLLMGVAYGTKKTIEIMKKDSQN